MKYAIYDLSFQSTSFWFLLFCILAKSEAAAYGEACHLIFKQGPNEGFHETNTAPYGLDEKKFRLQHMLYPICALMDLSHSVVLWGQELPDLDLVKIGENGAFSLPDVLETYKKMPLVWPQPSERAASMMRKKFPKRPFTITLRETYSKDRNSDTEIWLDFAREISEKENIVFIRDTDRWCQDLGNGKLEPFEVCDLASVDLDFRLALYQHAKMNFSVGGGSSTLLHFSENIPYRSFKFVRSEKTMNKSKEKAGNKVIFSSSEEETRKRAEAEGATYCFVTQEELAKAVRQGLQKISVPNSIGGHSIIDVFPKGQKLQSKGAATKESLTKQGLPPGSQFPWATENQKIIWEDDNLEVLIKEYNNLCY